MLSCFFFFSISLSLSLHLSLFHYYIFLLLLFPSFLFDFSPLMWSTADINQMWRSYSISHQNIRHFPCLIYPNFIPFSLSLSLSLLEFIFSDLWFDFVVVVGCGSGVYLCVRTGWKWRTGVFIKHPKRELHLSNKLRGNIPGRVHSSDRDGFHRIGRLRPQLGRVESSSCWI